MLANKSKLPIHVNQERIEKFCRKWKVRELSLFGSVLRNDFGPASDVDILVTFEPNWPWSYWQWPDMTDELKSIFNRDVDLVEREALKNPFRRHHILSNKQVIHAT